MAKVLKRKAKNALKRIKKGHDVHALYRDLETFIKHCEEMRVKLVKIKWNKNPEIKLNGVDFMCNRITRAKESVADLVHSVVGKIFDGQLEEYYQNRDYVSWKADEVKRKNKHV